MPKKENWINTWSKEEDSILTNWLFEPHNESFESLQNNLNNKSIDAIQLRINYLKDTLNSAINQDYDDSTNNQLRQGIMVSCPYGRSMEQSSNNS